jgi:signal transduction histidine kinase/DNA-binding response OmpR family regulator
MVALDPAAASPDDQPVQVLVVDDDEKNLRALEALLSRLPAKTVLARSGDEALGALLRHDFAVILLDVQMPGLGGLETAALIRERERHRETPIIFLTAFSRSEAQLLRGYDLGAVDFLTKPIVPEEVLREKVGWFVAAHRQARLLERERERARAAERREHERAVREAKQRGEAEALRSEMERQRELLERLNRANDRLRVLSAVASDLLFAPDPAAVLGSLLERVSTHFGLEVCLLHLAVEGHLALTEHAGLSPPVLAEVRAVPEERLLAHAVARRRARLVVEEDLARGSDEYPALRLMQVSAAACFPLVAGERLLGTLTLATRTRPRFHADELDALELTAEHVAMALERARLVAELRRRADELAEADRRKDEFLAMLAHELRNPLAPILSGVEILRADGAGPDVRRRALDAADRQVRHLARLVDDLLDVSRIRTGKVELRRERVELRRVLDDAAAAVERLVREQEQELLVEVAGGPLAVDGDPVRLTQVMENLLHNAAKYTDARGHIWLGARREGGEVVVRVSDDGIGIGPELLPRIFDTFVQGKQPASRARGGLGLGLTLVRSLVELHGGTVRASSRGPGLGSTFEVRLPAAPVAPERGAGDGRPNGANGDGARLRIALIEDNPDVRDTLRQLLELRGHEVVFAEDGLAGVELVRSHRPDVALVDIGLPGLDGYEVAERLRDASTRLVALTGYGGAEDRSRAAHAGFDAHLVKPIDLEALTRVLDDLAHREGAQPCPTP